MSTQSKGETAAWFLVILSDKTEKNIYCFDILKRLEWWATTTLNINNQRHADLLYYKDIVSCKCMFAES